MRRSSRAERTARQLPLLLADQDADGRLVAHQHPSDVTFIGGLDAPVHRWFRLTPSFSPQLVSALLDEFGGRRAHVLDPFAGRGTTPIECQLRGVPATGVEINPFLHWTAATSLDWSPSSKDVARAVGEVVSNARTVRTKHAGDSPEVVAATLKVGFPAIHDVYRWWRADVLRDLLAVKGCIHGMRLDEPIRSLLLLALARCLLDATNVEFGRLQLHFVDRSCEAIDAIGLFSESGALICEDLALIQKAPHTGRAAMLHANALDPRRLPLHERPTLVITSPPYPNRYSYVWNTRPHLYFFDFFQTPRQASSLDCDTIGGTWGTATSRHARSAFAFSDDAVADTVGSVVGQIRERSLLMSNYVAMYFDDLFRHLVALRPCLAADATCAYVVGNSRVSKVVVETDLLLASLFRKAGYRMLRIEEIRRRHSGKELRESVVLASSGPRAS